MSATVRYHSHGALIAAEQTAAGGGDTPHGDADKSMGCALL